MTAVRCLNCARLFPTPTAYLHPTHRCPHTGDDRPLAPVIPLHRKEPS